MDTKQLVETNGGMPSQTMIPMGIRMGQMPMPPFCNRLPDHDGAKLPAAACF